MSKREKIIFYCAFFAVLLTLSDRLLINPVFSKINSLDKEILEKVSGIEKNLRILAQKDRILTESSKYSPFLSSQKSEEEETTSILKEIETLANKSSVYLIDMKPAGLKGAGSSKKYIINLSCEAQMEQLIEFMYNLESSDLLLLIDKYQIGPKSSESSVAKCSMSVVKIVAP